MNYRSGVVLVIVGSVLLAHNFDLIQWGWIRQWWPALLIVIGLWSIVSPDRYHSKSHKGSSGSDQRPPSDVA